MIFNSFPRGVQLDGKSYAAIPNKSAVAFSILAGLIIAGVSVAQETPAPPAKEAYAAFAAEHGGDAARGKVLFEGTSRGLCALCHTLDGTGAKAGPDLSGIGDKFGRADLVKSVLEPSSTIAVGYTTTVLTRKNGEVAAGVIKQATADWVEVMGADGVAVRVPMGEIADRRDLEQSLMPEGLQATMKVEEFADLIAYLETLKRPVDAGSGLRGGVPVARKGVVFEPFLGRGKPFAAPVWVAPVPGNAGCYVVLEHFGGSWLVRTGPEGELSREVFVDMRNVVRRGGATGLLALAFHPEFLKNRRYFLKYQIEEKGRISTVVVERRFDDAGQKDSGAEARELLKIPGVTQDHNGGGMVFGPDGLLYIGMGDTGPQRDPQGHGQDPGLLLGKILRIDVNGVSGSRPYLIPAGNPFVDRDGVRPEIFALGFREPWRMSFDPVTGDFWVGDVGQDRVEEVGIVRVGENHGWNVFEGHQPYSNQYRKTGVEYIPPVFSYPHSAGVSVTGGFVYRGKLAPAMAGWYIFADYESRRVWALTQNERKLDRIVELGRAPSRAVSFGLDERGELLLAGYDDGVIHRLILDRVDPAPQRTRVLSPTAEEGPVPWKHVLEEPHEGWQRPDFDDAAWPATPGGFGTRNTPAAVIRTEWRNNDIWLRREFTVSGSTAGQALTLRVHHDEDAEFYLNGIEIARLGRWTQGYVNINLTDVAVQALKPGRNVLAVHCHQNGGGQYIDAGLIQVLDGNP
ncbi:MAG: putative glucose/L-sorbosone dehydrogenase, distantly related to bacterial beta-galactosidase [Verrucomicrobiales bacterium]|nr:putative glucose/L-sorbosone dehydrogenase, distantly related to bacterial beta-galactosidase [Verrucomicrobiales bacterium]